MLTPIDWQEEREGEQRLCLPTYEPPSRFAPGSILLATCHLPSQEEREAEQRLREAYRKCFELSQQAYQRGDREQANVLSQEGQRWREQYNQERERSGRRIGRRM